MPDVISMEQCRAARALLDWTQEELANAANLSLSTVRDFEKGRRTPISNKHADAKAGFRG
ncbi:helix-turn-helix transcriptional regulator [Chenggangzhangella methanolivorans]|nr:helix-turn-helix transcriptional regulator [Chenggangzhangella methanolivorans]